MKRGKKERKKERYKQKQNSNTLNEIKIGKSQVIVKQKHIKGIKKHKQTNIKKSR